MKKSGSLRFASGSAASEVPMWDNGDHFFAQGSDDDGRERAQPFLSAEFFHEIADIGERFAGSDAHADVGGAVCDTDSQADAAARDFVHDSGALGKIGHGALIDRCDGGAENNRIRFPRQRLAQRHVAEGAGGENAGVTAFLDFLGEFQRAAAATGDGNQAKGGEFGHIDAPGRCWAEVNPVATRW